MLLGARINDILIYLKAMPDKEERTVSMRINISESLRNLFKAKAAKDGKTMNEAAIDLIDEYVEPEKPKSNKSK